MARTLHVSRHGYLDTARMHNSIDMHNHDPIYNTDTQSNGVRVGVHVGAAQLSLTTNIVVEAKKNNFNYG